MNRHTDPGWVGGVDIPLGWDMDCPTCRGCGNELSPSEQDFGREYCLDCFDVCQVCFDPVPTNSGSYEDGVFTCNKCKENTE